MQFPNFLLFYTGGWVVVGERSHCGAMGGAIPGPVTYLISDMIYLGTEVKYGHGSAADFPQTLATDIDVADPILHTM